MPNEPGTGSGNKSSSNESVGHVRSVLARNNIYIQKPDAAERGAQLIKKARNIVQAPRKSILEIKTAEELQRLALLHETDNELTFLVNVWGVLLNKERWAKKTDHDSITDEEAIQWIEKAWAKDHLKCNWGADFISGSIPPVEFGEDIPEALIKTIPRVKNPKPDLTYGLCEEAFTKAQRLVNSTHGARLSINLDHPGLCVEVKSAGAPISEATNQCARAGAATIYLKRRFIKLARGATDEVDAVDQDPEATDRAQQNTEGSGHVSEHGTGKATQPTGTSSAQDPLFKMDENCFTFSLAVDPHLAFLYVNWAEEEFSSGNKKATVCYQMNLLDSYCLERPEEWVKLHHDIDNVLDWIVGKHKRDQSALCNQIAAHISNNKKRKA